jgi:FMN reductase
MYFASWLPSDVGGEGFGKMSSTIVVSGSPAHPSKTAILGDHVVARLKTSGIEATHLRLRDLPGDGLLSCDARHPAIAREIERLAASDGVVFVTPIYKASFSGLLKLFIDLLPQFGLKDKVAMPLATGGTTAHVLALDYGLRPVLQSLGARHIVQSFFVLQSEIDVDAGKVSKAIADAPFFCQVFNEFCESVTARQFLQQIGANSNESRGPSYRSEI